MVYRRRARSRIASLVSLGMALGCASFEIEGDGSKTPESAHGSAVVHTSFYRERPWSGWQVSKCENQLGLYRVEVQTNPLYLLAQVVTLGVYVPQGVEWWCQAPAPGPDGDLFDPDAGS